MSATTTLPRPTAMPLNPAGLPNDPLLQQSNIVVWDYTWTADKGKWDKPPLRPRDGYPASVTAPRDWGTLADGLAAVDRFGFDGIGVVLTGKEGVVGIDLDKCRDRIGGEIADWAQAIIDRFASYWEPSASGTGIRIFIRATLPPGRRRLGNIEVYDSGRYLTINGNPGPSASRCFEERQAELDAWHADLFPAEPEPTPVHRGHPPTSNDDATALDKARNAGNGAKFCRLYDAGDWEGEGYASRSEARAAVCSMIGFWVNRDRSRIERCFEGSALYDEKKWPRERANVLALASKGEAFDWSKDAAPPLSSVDTPLCPDDESLGAYLAMSHHDLAQLAAERGRRLDAIDDLLTSPTMTEVEKVVAYGVIKAAAVAQKSRDEDAPTREIVVNQKAIACSIGISRQTVGKTLERWTGQGYMQKEARRTGVFTKQGQEIQETVLQLPAQTLTDNLIMASTWERAADAPKQGGNGKRCPACNSAETRKKVESAKVRITTISCADCGHVLSEQIGEPTDRKTIETSYPPTQVDIPTMIDPAIIAELRRTASTVDTPPVAELTSLQTVEDVDNAGTPPLSTLDTPPPVTVIGPAFCIDCGAEGRRPSGEVWTCARCVRIRRGESSPYDRQAGD